MSEVRTARGSAGGRKLDPPVWHPQPFCRTSWTSEAARAAWEPRFHEALDALEDLAVLRCAEDGERRLLFARPSSGERLRALATERRVGVWSLEAADSPHGVAAGRSGRLALWVGGDGPSSPRQVPRPAAERHPHLDPIWFLALGTPDAETTNDGKSVTVTATWASNPLLAPLGLVLMPPWPDAFASAAWDAEGLALLRAAEVHSRANAVEDLREVLSWPMSWTALHGIAEIKTPLFRFIRDTPHTPEKLTVHWIGGELPAGAARGLGFPFARRRVAVGR